MLNSVRLQDHMVAKPVRIKPDANLLEAVDLITRNKISGLCVVDDNDRLIGILSELDCLGGILDATYNEAGVGPVSQYMTSENLVVASIRDNIVELSQDMLKHKHRRRPVVEDGKLVGQVTCRQLLIAVKSFRK